MTSGRVVRLSRFRVGAAVGSLLLSPIIFLCGVRGATGGGPVAQGWSVSLFALPERQHLGRAVFLHVRVTNVDASWPYLSQGDSACGYHVEVVGADSRLQLPERRRPCDYYGLGVLVRQGDAFGAVIPLEHYSEIKKAGTYDVRITAIEISPEPRVTSTWLPVQSNVVTVQFSDSEDPNTRASPRGRSFPY